MSKATLLRILRTLELHEVIRRRESDRSFTLGPGIIRLGTLALRHSGVLEVSRPYIKRLQVITGETVCVFMVSGTDRMCVDVVPSQHDLRMTIDVGATRPLHAGAAGKVLVAFMPAQDIRRILLGRRLPELTEKTVTSPARLFRQLEEIRRKGVAVSHGESVRGAAAIAAPIFGRDHSVIAAVNVLGPSIRLTSGRIQQFIPAVLEAAAAISRELGHGLSMISGAR